MNKEELREKRKRANESLNDIKALLGLDEMYIDELEKENAELKKQLKTVKKMCCGNGFCAYRSEISLSKVEKNDSKSRM